MEAQGSLPRCGLCCLKLHGKLALDGWSPSPSPSQTALPPSPCPTHTQQYKFIVDGEWKYDPNQPAMFDEMGNVNNVLEVHEYVPENLDGLSGFEPPPSPPSR